MLKAHEVDAAVLDELRRVMEDAGLEARPAPPEARLNADLGLSSLDLAQLVATLEVELDADPFAELVAITSVRTVGDLCEAYRRSLAGEETPEEDAELEAARARAAARRARRAGR